MFLARNACPRKRLKFLLKNYLANILITFKIMEEVKGYFDYCISEVCFRDHFEKTAKQLQERKFCL